MKNPLSKLRPRSTPPSRADAYAFLPDFMFAKWVNPYERWVVELMYLIREAIKADLPDKATFFTDESMASNAYTYVINEASIAMTDYLHALDQSDAHIPLHLLEPLLAVAKYVVDDNEQQELASLSRRLPTKAKRK